MSPNRIVALVTPACALAAGWAATWLADNVPGLNITKENLQAVFIAGAVAVLAPALHWLNGWQKWEARNEEAIREAQAGTVQSAIVVPAEDGGAVEEGAFDLGDDELDELDELDDLVDFDDFEDMSVTSDDELAPAGS